MNRSCNLLTPGSARIPFADLPTLRRKAPPVADRSGAPLALRQADEHTLVAVEALNAAIQAIGRPAESYGDWGVLVASRYPGRVGLASIIHRFAKLGPIGISPMSVPTMSLHSAAGTLSVAFGLQGPNFGVAGGRGHVAEGLLAGLSLLEENLAPGVWLVLTAADPELVPDELGKVASTGSMHAVALGLTTAQEGVLQLRITNEGDPLREPAPLLDLMRALDDGIGAWQCPLIGGGSATLSRREALRKAG